jgi:hypothetical protein
MGPINSRDVRGPSLSPSDRRYNSDKGTSVGPGEYPIFLPLSLRVAEYQVTMVAIDRHSD